MLDDSLNDHSRTTTKTASTDWYITSRHFVAGRTSRREPQGVHHLRQFGDLQTACGEWAAEWPMYFDRRVDVRNADLCHGCARGIGLRA